MTRPLRDGLHEDERGVLGTPRLEALEQGLEAAGEIEEPRLLVAGPDVANADLHQVRMLALIRLADQG